MIDGEAPVVRLSRWSGSWEDGDPNANLKDDIATSGVLDPLVTLAAQTQEAPASRSVRSFAGLLVLDESSSGSSTSPTR